MKQSFVVAVILIVGLNNFGSCNTDPDYYDLFGTSDTTPSVVKVPKVTTLPTPPRVTAVPKSVENAARLSLVPDADWEDPEVSKSIKFDSFTLSNIPTGL
jgi:hypothetical protein